MRAGHEYSKASMIKLESNQRMRTGWVMKSQSGIGAIFSANSATYGARCEAHFRGQAPESMKGELELFRALRTSLEIASTHAVKTAGHEYHGGGRQVMFTGPGGYSRKNARCELADLAIVSYSPKTVSARIAFVQAKFEKLSRKSCCLVPADLQANLEQWDLLARRPAIQGVGRKFKPPSNLLSGAVFDSIGSFVFFTKCGRCGAIGTRFDVAADLKRVVRYTKRNGRLTLPGAMRVGGRLFRVGSIGTVIHEARSLPNVETFASALADQLIGEPINLLPNENPALRVWLDRQLRAAKDSGGPEFQELASELRQILEVRDSGNLGTPGFGAKALMILKSNAFSDG